MNIINKLKFINIIIFKQYGLIIKQIEQYYQLLDNNIWDSINREIKVIPKIIINHKTEMIFNTNGIYDANK